LNHVIATFSKQLAELLAVKLQCMYQPIINTPTITAAETA